MSGYDDWLTTEPVERQHALAPDYDAETARDLRWATFEDACREFAESEPDGYAAVLRAVSRAMATQGSLLK